MSLPATAGDKAAIFLTRASKNWARIRCADSKRGYWSPVSRVSHAISKGSRYVAS